MTNSPALLRKPYQQAIAAAVLLVLAGSALTVAVHRLLAENTIGIDLFVFWSSGRAMFVDGSSPYDPAVNRQVQLAIFGRLAQQGEDPMLYPFPPYGLLPILPLVALPFDWAQAVWFVFYLLAACSLPYVLFPRASRWVTLSLLALYPVTFALILGNYVFLIGLILLLTFVKVVLHPAPDRRWQVLAGILLAWTTIKPQFVWLYLTFLVFYTLRERRWALAASFLSALGLMLLLSWIWLPSWLGDWLRQVQDYAQFNQVESNAQSFLRLALPEAWAVAAHLAALVGCIAATAWWLWRWWRGLFQTLPLLAWLGFVTNLFDPRAISYEQIVLVVPFFIWAAQKKAHARIWLVGLALTWALFAASRFYPLATEQGPLLFYAVWLAWYIRQPGSRASFSKREIGDRPAQAGA